MSRCCSAGSRRSSASRSYTCCSREPIDWWLPPCHNCSRTSACRPGWPQAPCSCSKSLILWYRRFGHMFRCGSESHCLSSRHRRRYGSERARMYRPSPSRASSLNTARCPIPRSRHSSYQSSSYRGIPNSPPPSGSSPAPSRHCNHCSTQLCRRISGTVPFESPWRSMNKSY